MVGREENPSGPIASQILDPRKIQFGQTLQNAPLTITGGGDRTNGDMGSRESVGLVNGLNTEESNLTLDAAQAPNGVPGLHPGH